MSASYISFWIILFRHWVLKWHFYLHVQVLTWFNVSPSYQHTTAVVGVGVNMDCAVCRCSDRNLSWTLTEPFLNTDSTFLEHGDTQILFTLWLSAAHDRLRLALLCGGVTHCQDLDLTIILLGSQAIDRCWATIPQEQTPSKYSCTAVQQSVSHVNIQLMIKWIPAK